MLLLYLRKKEGSFFKEANRLSLMEEPKIYKQGKTTYRVWDLHIEDCWDGYGKKARVIVSEETTKIRMHARDGKGWEEKTETTNSNVGNKSFLKILKVILKIPLKYATAGGRLQNKCCR